MGTKTDRMAKRAIAIEAEQKKRWAARAERCPVSRKTFHELIDYVALQIEESGVNEGFLYASAWCESESIDHTKIVEFLMAEGARDDWSLVLECDPYRLFGPAEGRRCRMPLERAQLEELIEYLEELVPQHGCQHDFELTRSWLERKGLVDMHIEMALIGQGGCCDCEVVLNVDVDFVYTPDTQ